MTPKRCQPRKGEPRKGVSPEKVSSPGGTQRGTQRGRESLFLFPRPAAISEGVLQAQGARMGN